MKGQIIDTTSTEAVIALADGTILNIAMSQLPYNSRTGDKINIEPFQTKMTGKSFINVSTPPIC
ncbi:MAG: hypothetical protein LKE46_13890 [Clostridium sp.]|uniref:hypothetical protein n=1 Tax=Clostridium sp. TaxID=1506 RepID=UPI0025C067FA|nr:hypothetical protein [Clostridium sp.]MCH3965347.1 hypothetical protein [Clostridium sp.]MCI1714568.1 hypothetical protein [Clostridium sp.]MCI1798830.1 hypothetical protein [Clostridium sp.]MCI1812439.1 hypothetical protein [Clostridium sp.]MCI1869640.1 hypothetical protein [Clostridium sp.]